MSLAALCVTLCIAAQSGWARDVWPSDAWPQAAPEEMGMSTEPLAQARDYALTGGGSGIIIRAGRCVMSWGDQAALYDLKSSTKSIGMMALGLALKDGLVSLDDRAVGRCPSFGVPPDANVDTGWLEGITLLHLATQTAGFAKPGGFEPLLFEPGTAWAYSDGGPNWLADVVTTAYGRDLRDLLSERIFGPIGIAPEALTWRNNASRPSELAEVPRREFGSGISAGVDAMARIGYLHLRNGTWGRRQLLPPEYCDLVRVPHPLSAGLTVISPETYGNASDHYGLLWWNNGDKALPGVPRDAYWSWGLHDSLIVVIPSLDIVAARAGGGWERQPEWSAHYDVLAPFLQPLVDAVRVAMVPDTAPCPPSERVVGIAWDPPQRILRSAEGSDNWPSVELEDGSLLVAWGDGHGFEPGTPNKLSLGLARVVGAPPEFTGENLSSSIEATGDGPSGPKASGALRDGDTLYLLVRNTGNATLAWSEDGGRTWTYAPWRSETGFGCPTFMGDRPAGDGYVYLCSPDAEDAYTPADRMVLARVPRARIREQEAYEYFAGALPDGSPRWSADVADRAGVIESKGRCYRSGVRRSEALNTYLWSATLPGPDGKPAGLAVYESPTPWGPWRTVYYAQEWDADPGESAHFPTPWIDGAWLLHSGEDAFSIRGAEIVPASAE